MNESDPDGTDAAGDKILAIARTKADSSHWATKTTENLTGTGSGCSGFVFDCAKNAGFRPHIKKPSYKGKVIPTADDWATGNVIGWTIVPNSQAQPGDVIAYKHIQHNGPGGAVSSTGHCGFFEGFYHKDHGWIALWWRYEDGLNYIGSSGGDEKVHDEKPNNSFGIVDGVNHNYVTLRHSAPTHHHHR